MANVLHAPEVIPSGEAAGAEIAGVDVAAGLDDATFSVIETALHDHGVVVLRRQTIRDEDHIAFTRRFGEIGSNTFAGYHAHPKFPNEMLVISNIKVDGRYVGNPDAGHTWHTDQSYTPCPPRATILYAIEIPERDGKPLGDTLYANAAAAYDALPAAMKKRLEGLMAVHNIAARKRGGDAPKKVEGELADKHPDVIHPVVRTHPFTGRKCLYVNTGECTGIVGMPDDEALPLIEELFRQTVKPEFVYRHRWQAGDLIVWDNCMVQHLATKDYKPEDRRYLHRTIVLGTAPF
ncbi:MAG: TauD/TfdA family dioxygenase [Rhodospirillales bacterium]